MKHPARMLAAAVGVVVVALAIVLATQVGSDPTIRESRLLGARVPDFTVETLEGARLTADDLAGRAVIVNFWNSWCIPCENELPALKEFYARHAEDPDFLMVGIVREDTERAIRADVATERIGWTIGLDPDASASLAFGTRGQPETFAIDTRGRVVGFQYSESTVANLETMLRAARRA